jgi:predicted DNA-binding protein (MmcQ/YjbR family)
LDIEEFREYCLSKVGATESFPFDDKTLVFKVVNKMFALIDFESIDPSANLKCDPERAIQLREKYGDIIPGYHMNKRHWNTVTIGNELDNHMIKSLIDHSYDLVVKSLKKVDKEFLKALIDNGK